METNNRISLKKCLSSLLLATAIGLATTGCQTYQEQNHVIQYWHQGNMTNAVVEAKKMADQNANNKDTVIWRLEEGAVLRGAGKYEESNKAFDQAQEKIDQYSQEAEGPGRAGSRRLVVQSGQSGL